MGLGKNKTYKYNPSHDNSLSHFVDEKTNFNLRPITLEDIDKTVFFQFDKFFLIKKHPVALIKLDSEVMAQKIENAIQHDSLKQFLDLPYVTFIRKGKKTLGRVSPSNKPSVYSRPIMTADGVVIEDWIVSPPIRVELEYNLNFYTTFRTQANEFEEQYELYFKNKRNTIVFDNEVFEVIPEDPERLLETEIEGKMYILRGVIKVSAYLRLEPVLKKIRPSKIDINISERCYKIGEGINEHFETTNAANE